MEETVRIRVPKQAEKGDAKAETPPAEEGAVACAEPAPIEGASHTECPVVASQTVCIEAVVTVKPSVTIGDPKVVCVGPAKIGPCPGKPCDTQDCTFTVHQNVCVQVPLSFGATAVAKPGKFVCSTPETDPCPTC